MSDQNLCPKCGDALPYRAKSCGCGWGVPHRRASDPPVRDGRCCYEANGLRCKYPGNNSHGISGGGPWYCSVHIAETGSRFARQALEESQSWTPPVEPELDPRIDPWFIANLPVRTGESKHEFAMRCKVHSLAMLKGFKVRPVVNAEPVGAGLGPRMREPGEDEIEA